MGHPLHRYEIALVSLQTSVYAIFQTFVSKHITGELVSCLQTPDQDEAYSCREYKPSSIAASSTSIAAG